MACFMMDICRRQRHLILVGEFYWWDIVHSYGHVDFFALRFFDQAFQ